MNAISLIRDCRAAGIRLQVRGDRLHVEAPAGTLTAELRQQLANHKVDIMALHAIRARLHTIAKSLGIPRAVVDNLPAEELADTAEQARSFEGHTDSESKPLAQLLLVAYLKLLAGICEQPAGGVE